MANAKFLIEQAILISYHQNPIASMFLPVITKTSIVLTRNSRYEYFMSATRTKDGPLEEFRNARATSFLTRINAYLDGNDSSLYYIVYLHAFYSPTEVNTNKLILDKFISELLEESEENHLNWRHAVLIAYSYLIKRDFKKATEYFSLAEKKGALQTLVTTIEGWRRKSGLGMTQDLHQAENLLTMAADAGDLDAKYHLALLLKNNPIVVGIKQDFVSLLKQAASCNPLAQIALAQHHFEIMNYSIAYEYFAIAARQGFPGGIHGIGMILLKSNGQKQDLSKAIEYLQSAAETEDPQALIDLGKIYYKGELQEKDWTKTAAFFRRGGERGKELLKQLSTNVKKPDFLGGNSQHTFAVEYQTAIALEDRPALTHLADTNPEQFRHLASEENWSQLRPLLKDNTAKSFLKELKKCTDITKESMLTNTKLDAPIIQTILEYCADSSYLANNIPVGDPILEAFKTTNGISYLDRINRFRNGDDDSLTYIVNPEIYYSNNECKSINEKYITFLKEEKNNPREKLLHGIAFLFGKGGIEPNLAKARQFFIEASESNEVRALAYNMIGLTYDKEKNYLQAEQFYRIASQLGDRHALYNLIALNDDLIDTNIDPLIEAAEKSYPPAQSDLGDYLKLKEPYNINQTLNFFTKAAKQGHPDALVKLAVMMKNGEHMPHDIERAKEYIIAAASKDNPQALILLGKFYQEGNMFPIENDLAKAAELYRRAYQLNPDNTSEAKQALSQLLKIADSWSFFSSTTKSYFSIKFHAAIALNKKSILTELATQNSTWFRDLLEKEDNDTKYSLLPPIHRPGSRPTHRQESKELRKDYQPKFN